MQHVRILCAHSTLFRICHPARHLLQAYKQGRHTEKKDFNETKKRQYKPALF